MTEPDPTPVPDPEPVEPINPAPAPPPDPQEPPGEEQQTRRPRGVPAQGYAVGGVVPPGNAYMVGESGPEHVDLPPGAVVR